MPSYDPQRSRHRPSPADDDQPAPVDALLEPHPAEPTLPEGVELEITEAGGAVLHTAAADVELTASGDDVVIATDDAVVEVRADADEIVVEAGGEEIHIDTTPRDTDPAAVAAEWLDDDGGAPSVGRSKLVLAVVAALAALLAVLIWGRRRNS
jgi:hypothetical protein